MSLMKLSTVVIALGACLAQGRLKGNVSPDNHQATQRSPAKKFNDLLRATMLEVGLHRLNQTLNSSQVPISQTLFMVGTGCSISNLARAVEMTKDPASNKFTTTAHLKPGNLVFVPSRSTWNNAYNIEEASMVREEEFCTHCGMDAHLRMSGEPGAIEMPGPSRRGIFRVEVDLDAGTVSYHCGDRCWRYRQGGSDDLWAVGPNICDGDDPNTEGNWDERRGPRLVKDPDAMIWRGTLHMCPPRNNRGFKIYRYEGDSQDDVGLWAGSFVTENTGNLASNFHGHLKQWRDDTIPGPDVEAMMSLVVDWGAGTISLTCVDMCNGPRLLNYTRFQASNPVHGSSEAFVHLFSWRWTDIAIECEQWLAAKGVKAVQIAPPQESKVPRPGRPDSWNYNYRPVSYRLDSKMGTEAELKDMIDRCHAVGVDIYVDAVINHMAGAGGRGSAGARFGGRSFPDAGYTPADFHHTGDDLTTNCRLRPRDPTCDHHCELTCDFNGMPDLDTASPRVQGMIAAYLNKVIDLGVAGFRIDAADHIAAPDLEGILAEVQPKWRFAESHDYIDKLALSAVTMFSYRRQLGEALIEGQISQLRLIGEPSGLCPSQDAVVFVVNHDMMMTGDPSGNGIIYKQPALYTLLNVVMLALPYGYPKVLSSFYYPDGADQSYPMPAVPVHAADGSLRCGDGTNWVCEHRWPAIANMFNFRKAAGSEIITSWTLLADNQAYFCRGPNACIIINSAEEPLSVAPTLSLPEGEYCNVIESDDPSQCSLTKVNADGTTDGAVVVPPTSAVAFHTGCRAGGSLLQEEGRHRKAAI